MKKHVLLVDDDRLPMQYYANALKLKGFEVQHCFDPDSALDFVKERAGQIDVIILDIMLPPGKAYENENTNEGLKTGVFLLKDIRDKCGNVPILVLTNVKNPKTLGEFKDKVSVRLVQKMDCPPFKLAELVESLVSRAK